MNKMISINQFGAIPNSGNDATPAFVQAIKACWTQRNAQIVFKKGRYDFYPALSAPASPIANLEGLTGLVIDGAGSEMILHGIMGFMGIGRCKDITIKNMTIDYTVPNHSMGTITAITPTSYDVQIHPGYTVAPDAKVTAAMEYDPATKRPLKHGADEYYNVSELQHIGPQQVRCLTKAPTIMKLHSWVNLRHHVYDGSVIVTNENTNLKLDNITLHNSPGMGFTIGKCHNGQFTRLTIKPRAAASPYQSTGADAIHLAGCTGDILVDRCHFESMGDDGVNLKTGLYLTIKEIIDKRTVMAQHNLKIPDQPDKDDVMELLSQDDLITMGSAKVTQAQLLEDGLFKLSFDTDLPQTAVVGNILGNVSRCCHATIRRVVVKNNRGRGLLIQNHDTLVEDCRFENCTMGGVWVFNEVVYFFESIAPRNVTVRRCFFKNVADIHANVCVLGCWAYLSGWRLPQKPGVFRNIVFDRNTIDGTDNSGILITGGTNVTAKNNTIINACKSPTVPSGVYALEVDASSQVTLSNNTVVKQKQATGCKESLHLGQYQQANELSSSGNHGF